MQLFVKTFTGKTITLQLNPSSSVRETKQQILEKEGTP